MKESIPKTLKPVFQNEKLCACFSFITAMGFHWWLLVVGDMAKSTGKKTNLTSLIPPHRFQKKKNPKPQLFIIPKAN